MREDEEHRSNSVVCLFFQVDGLNGCHIDGELNRFAGAATSPLITGRISSSRSLFSKWIPQNEIKGDALHFNDFPTVLPKKTNKLDAVTRRGEELV